MPTNLEIATSKLLHPSNSKNFSQQDRDSIQTHYSPFPIVEFLSEELSPAYEINKPEYADDEFAGDTMNRIENLILDDNHAFQDKYKKLVYEYIDGYITVDEFMAYGSALSRRERKKQVSENPGTTTNTAQKDSKLPSQSVNSVTSSGSAETPARGILSIRFIRTIASKLLVKRGNEDKS